MALHNIVKPALSVIIDIQVNYYIVFEIVTYAMIEYIFELTRNETAISTLISLTPYDSK